VKIFVPYPPTYTSPEHVSAVNLKIRERTQQSLDSMALDLSHD
jgi:hypothetical protein